jgi:hypothetical protein
MAKTSERVDPRAFQTPTNQSALARVATPNGLLLLNSFVRICWVDPLYLEPPGVGSCFVPQLPILLILLKHICNPWIRKFFLRQKLESLFPLSPEAPIKSMRRSKQWINVPREVLEGGLSALHCLCPWHGLGVAKLKFELKQAIIVLECCGIYEPLIFLRQKAVELRLGFLDRVLKMQLVGRVGLGNDLVV